MISIIGAIWGNKQSAATLPFDHELLSEITRWITSRLELFIKLVPTYPNNEKNIRHRIKEENCRLGSEVSKKKKFKHRWKSREYYILCGIVTCTVLAKVDQKGKILLPMTRSLLLRNGSSFLILAEFSLSFPSVCPKCKRLNKTNNNQPPRLWEASIRLKGGKTHSIVKITCLINLFWLKVQKKSIILNNILL